MIAKHHPMMHRLLEGIFKSGTPAETPVQRWRGRDEALWFLEFHDCGNRDELQFGFDDRRSLSQPRA